MSLLLARAASAGGVSGSLAVTLDDVTTRTGVQLPLLLTSGAFSNANGTVATGGGPVSGSLAVTLDGVTLSASGVIPVTGTLSSTLAAVTLSAAGAVAIRGTLTATLADVTVSAAGAVAVRGTLSQTLADVTASASGLVTNGPTGVLNVTLADVTASGAGTVTGTGTPAEETLSGGYLSEARRQRRRKKKSPGAPPSTEAQAGPGLPDATPEAPAADLELVRQLVAYWTGEADRELLNRRAQRALDYALRAQTVLAMQMFERELARQMEDDDIAAVLMILADD